MKNENKIKNSTARVRIGALLLAMLIAVLSVASLTSCAPPKLEDVKEIYVDLIKRSADVNQILFGSGLSVYGEIAYEPESKTYYSVFYTKELGKLCAYYDKATGEYITLKYGEPGEDAVYTDKEKGIYLYPCDYKYEDNGGNLPPEPMNYKFVRFDERCVTVNEISTLAASVYSEDYLGEVFENVMGGVIGEDYVMNETFVPKYREMFDSFTGKKYLVKASISECPALITEERVFDFDSIEIKRGSKKKFVTVSIRSYGRYVDVEAGEILTGWSTIELSFVLQNGEWRLDTPTY
jgi:hypothetical protein